MKYNYLINIIGLRRSGIHAQIRWFAGHFNKSLFINDSSKALYSSYPVKKIFKDTKGDGKVCNKNESADAIILGHEEISPGGFVNKFKCNKFQTALSNLSVKKIINVMMLRDPYNHFASRTTLSKMVKPAYADLYRPYMDEFDGKTTFLKDAFGNNFLIVLYNKWFLDAEYRKEISEYFGIPHSDSGLNFMMPYGGGSSFDRMKSSTSAQSMDVLNRWKKLRENEEYMQFFKDNPDIDKFSRRVFGIPT